MHRTFILNNMERRAVSLRQLSFLYSLQNTLSCKFKTSCLAENT